MQFGARTTGSGVTHHPEIIFFVTINNVHGRIETRGPKNPRPNIVSLLVEIGRIALRFIRRVDRGEESFGWNAPNFG